MPQPYSGVAHRNLHVIRGQFPIAVAAVILRLADHASLKVAKPAGRRVDFGTGSCSLCTTDDRLESRTGGTVYGETASRCKIAHAVER